MEKLVHSLCPVCLAEMAEYTTLATEGVGIAHYPCDTCKAKSPNGIYLIEIGKVDGAKIPERTGNVIAVSEEFYSKTFHKPIPSRRVCYVLAPIVENIQREYTELYPDSLPSGT